MEYSNREYYDWKQLWPVSSTKPEEQIKRSGRLRRLYDAAIIITTPFLVGIGVRDDYLQTKRHQIDDKYRVHGLVNSPVVQNALNHASHMATTVGIISGIAAAAIASLAILSHKLRNPRKSRSYSGRMSVTSEDGDHFLVLSPEMRLRRTRDQKYFGAFDLFMFLQEINAQSKSVGIDFASKSDGTIGPIKLVCDPMDMTLSEGKMTLEGELQRGKSQGDGLDMYAQILDSHFDRFREGELTYREFKALLNHERKVSREAAKSGRDRLGGERLELRVPLRDGSEVRQIRQLIEYGEGSETFRLQSHRRIKA